MRAVLDTNVILDALQHREPFASDAERIFLLAANNRAACCITAKSATDIYYLTHRLTHSDKETRAILNKLFSLFEVIDTAGIDCRRALPSAVSDYEDAVLTESAARIEADCVVTRNIKDFIKAPLPIMTPSDFIRAVEETEMK